ncbi:acyl-CoA reductase-like NAD-dependent aldehyde dehydrogenase [Polaromonas sp. CG_9.7]|nr:acyl-CoA reductase-like NAD-dependent aldehyde dehydrogenase [Polaromonas sp. CG_9.7]MBG6115809.1 acyl-CoA reductase-like NAD-dependent aldehyde dehydrogenase [Polaromonas sp. CG_9.2]MDH6186711.1 acyl-CoA reductase-like NAD-dependent aldehyde dehydrogenase [Polaromonas sp. CG_23.6]
MGPLANARRITAMAEFTQDAVERGATLLAGGMRIGESGNFWQPTVLADVPQGARILNDEPFGPVAAIQSFNTLDEAILEANRLPFGLAGYAHFVIHNSGKIPPQERFEGKRWAGQALNLRR